MPAIVDQEARNHRAENLGALNGVDFVLVDLQPPAAPVEARLELHFFNTNALPAIVAAASASDDARRALFPVTGGHRVPAGPATGEVQTTAVTAGPTPTTLVLTVAPIGDYSTYTLRIDHALVDPIFAEIPFKFRPGCFRLCSPLPTADPPLPAPPIDYLAKDFDSFKHTMIAALMQRVPGWEPTSEADLDQVLLELFSAAADGLSDYQDRVMNEAYLGTARRRVSLTRHARLMDYHVHQGNQASTWLALELAPGTAGTLPAGLQAWTTTQALTDRSQVFLSRDQSRVNALLNRIGLYTWSDTQPALAAGSTSADLRLITDPLELAATTVQDLIRSGAVSRLLIQEWIDPATGNPAGRDPRKRQLLRLLSGPEAAEAQQDPLTNAWFVRVRWEDDDALLHNYCFTIDCQHGTVEDVSLFHGNLVRTFHGRPCKVDFLDPTKPLAADQPLQYERQYERSGTDDDGNPRWGTICRLPDVLLKTAETRGARAELQPLAYCDTPPGGEVPPRSTLEVELELPGGATDSWDERDSLVHSDGSPEGGDHYVVETDEERGSLIRFGNGTNGMLLPDDAIVHCRYQVGKPLEGNVGADSIVHLEKSLAPVLLAGATIWNPFDVVDARDPEPAALVIRRVPEAYRARQLRAVTLADYLRRAEELPRVSRAAARYAWTGSWRTVRITIDPVGTNVLDDTLRRQVADYLEAVRLIGEDLEIRPPRFVPLRIDVALCIDDTHWPEDVRPFIEQEFSSGYTADGRRGFFHPDEWTFGQELHASQITGRLHAVEGIEHVISVRMKRWDDVTAGTESIVGLRPNEIIQVLSDPDHMELGTIVFDLRGGRR
jgi:Baseplate J-like protein